MFDLAVVGGLLVSGRRVIRGDVAIADGTIAQQGVIDPDRAREVIDATGMLVLPGAVDEHVHPIYLDDAGATSIAAAPGGTTTMLVYAYAKPGMALDEAVEEMILHASSASILD
ncbi:MAG: hypothetical protein ACREDF_08625, partial [Thermoplasmata archaeon]